jgi:hypothetical protein
MLKRENFRKQTKNLNIVWKEFLLLFLFRGPMLAVLKVVSPGIDEGLITTHTFPSDAQPSLLIRQHDSTLHSTNKIGPSRRVPHR